jgi:hypothetical protein
VLLYWRKGNLAFTTDVEDWMADQEFTEVFRWRGEPSSEEKNVTRILDSILHEVRYGCKGIEDTLNEMGKGNSKIIKGRLAQAGEISLGAAEGCAVDAVFKTRLLNLLKSSDSPSNSMLTVVPRGDRGADVYSKSLMVAWDVTTVAQVWDHVERDVFGKRDPGKPRIGDIWDRYYLLVWDEPRSNRKREVAEIEAGRIDTAV